MRILLDTNVVLCKSQHRKVCQHRIGLEILMKPKLGLSAAGLEAGITAMGSIVLPVRFRHLDELSGLATYEDHRDPFDRMLIAQSLAEGLSIVSSDTRFSQYKRLRVIWE